MGKKLIIKGADFSENAVAQDMAWQTIISGTFTQDTYNSVKLFNLEPVLPLGTKTRLTWGLTGEGHAAAGGKDEEDVSHNNFWRTEIKSDFGTVSDEKVLTFNLVKLIIWIREIGSTVTYSLEAFM